MAPGPDLTESVRKFLIDYLHLPHIDEMPPLYVQRFRTPKSKFDDNVLVTFDSPVTRDYVKAASGNLAGQRGKVGIRIHIPAHLNPTSDTSTPSAYN